MRVEGSTVLVTGASSGIGAAAARELARRGARILMLARSADKLEAIAAEIQAAGGEARAYPCDVSDPEAVAETAGTIDSEVGSPDVIVNNAGAGRWLFVEETDPGELVQQTAVPYHAAFFVTRAFIEGMLARGSGQVVNVNTPASRFAFPGAIGYSSARWALRGFTESLRADLAGTGIVVSEVIPAKVASEYFDHNPGAEERIPKIDRIIPTLTPEQVANGIAKTIEQERREVSLPFIYRLLAAQARHFPRLNSWLMVKMGARRNPAS